MSCNCEHCNGELTDEECLTKRLESAQATIKTQKAALDEADITITNGKDTYKISAFDSQSIWIRCEDGEGMQVGFDLLDKFYKDTF